MFEDFDTAIPGAGLKRPAIPAGRNVKFAVEQMTTFAAPAGSGIKGQQFKLDAVVIDPGSSTVQPGTGATFLVQLTGHDYPSYKERDLGLIKMIVGSTFGLSDTAEIMGQVNSAVLAACVGPANPQRGRCFHADVTNIITKKKGVTLNVFDALRPALDAAGKPENADLGATPAPAPAVASVPRVGPPAVTPPPAPPAASFPPAGWTQHPQHPTHYYKGQEVLTEADLRSRV